MGKSPAAAPAPAAEQPPHELKRCPNGIILAPTSPRRPLFRPVPIVASAPTPSIPAGKIMDTNYSDQCNDGCSDHPPEKTHAFGPPKPPQPTHIQYPRTIKLDDYDPEKLNLCTFATSQLMRNILTDRFYIVGITCKRWGCPPCAREKIRTLATWTKLAAPNKLLTLTVNPKMHDNPELAWIATSPKLPELIRALRKRFGQIEYLRVCEMTEKGWPHYHCMLRSPYLPQPIVKKLWLELTGAEIVDIREVTQFFNSFSYLVKYLTKLRRIDWTDRHVTYSRNFFPVSITNTPEPNELRTWQRVQAHPLAYLRENYPDRYLIQTGPYSFELPDTPDTWLPPVETTATTTKQLTPAELF